MKAFTVVEAMRCLLRRTRHRIRPEGGFGRMERRKSFVRRIGEQDAFRRTILMLTKREGITDALLRPSPLAMDKQNVIEER